MAAFFGDKLVLPIGCSCIPEMQLLTSTRLPPRRTVPHFFDWAGATPDATVEILDRRAPFVESVDDLELVNGRACSRVIRGAYFWHINLYFKKPQLSKISSLSDHPEGMKRFLRHHRDLMVRLGKPMGEVHCLWSNIQPNLQFHAREVGEPWPNFVLTAGRYAAIKERCARLPARKVAVWFVCRREDMDTSLAARDDVVVLDVPRSDTDYKGEVGLFDPVFAKMGIALSDVPRPAPRASPTGNPGIP